MKQQIQLGAGAAIFALTACSGSSIQSSLVPPGSSTNPITGSTLQFAVGTANIAGTVGLNTLETLRQNSGASVGTSVLSNAPTIVGPAGFAVPSLANAPDAYGDAGTDHISGTIVTSLATLPPQTTFDPNPGGGATGNYLASSLGFFPGVVANSGLTPSLEPGPLPFYANNNPVLGGMGPGPIQYIGGPPEFTPPGHTSTQDGTFPGGYPGYTLAFTDFQAKPVSGTYTLSVVIPLGVNTSNRTSTYGTKTATATLNATKVLPTWATPPTFVPDGAGGGTITTNFAGGGGVTEEFIELVNTGPASCQTTGAAPIYYTFEVTAGTATVAVPDNIGPAAPGKAQPHTFCTATENNAADGAGTGEDAWEVYGFAGDYPIAEAGFPASNGVAAPTITTSGQDDVTTSAYSTGPVVDTGSALRRQIQGFLKHTH
jgi:hypothetical protein